jgi:elongation factor Ts
LARDICMHVTAMRPAVLFKEELEPAVVDKEREILSAAARKEGKPENIIAKMVEGRLRNFYAECCLAEQPFVKDDKKTVGQVAKEAGMKLVSFVRWELPKE